ncbi:MAG: hypothetical protein A2782_04545 [Candidatus Blackburnbacteria bacterium RIFCSPHIGHO2_01_FULL_43_15b]|uniref:Uncharacterized protein n=1 Tax=Candidatus Blackburnbacteria bacterium RIFCSPHIGHO2_01_FULL_43_15b TaxID=1797513 RepID=A0A1G1V3J0_9BACT|nr:MAG: hypothetical protein A2782_04545 [Candidatus Blackburnbacteria bacterium RIFCSPHIGHO2_01_FULL_43_15b]
MEKKAQERIRRNRNFLPALILGLIFLSLWLLMFFFVLPEGLFLILVFLILLFFWLFFISSLLLGNTRLGLFLGTGVLIFLGISYYGAGTWLNFLLIAGILIALEYTIATRS